LFSKNLTLFLQIPCTHKQKVNNNWDAGLIHDEFGTATHFIHTDIGIGAWFIYDESGSGAWCVHCMAAPLIPSAIRTLATSPPFAYPHAATVCNGGVSVNL
jgi:hypothetical protein